MTQRVSDKIKGNIIQIVKLFPQGASFDELFKELNSLLPRRSLQRYLSRLVQEGAINATGNGRARRYHWRSEKNLAPDLLPAESIFPLSPFALSIHTNVRRPLQQRRPVGYQWEFLNAYRPNETYYLTESMRNHLLTIGKSPDGDRPAGTYAKQILNRLLIDLSWNSSRLEGNTYSLLETQRLLELGEATEGKDSLEAQMILNHKAAIEFMVESSEYLRFNHFTICNLHAILSDNLLRDPRACGSLRSQPVAIAKSVYQPLAIPQLIQEYFQQILDTAEAILDPFEQSFFVMVHLPYLQPFLDVNKRVSRLAANIPFMRENLCPLSFVDVPQEIYISGLLGIYELNQIELLRDLFFWAYERSSALYSATCQQLGEPDPFRFRYRPRITKMIGEVVRQCMNKQAAVAYIKGEAEEVVVEDRMRFVELIEKELMGLHIGNIARFQLKPAEYDAWLKTWSRIDYI